MRNAWNKGLTKETSPIIAEIAKKKSDWWKNNPKKAAQAREKIKLNNAKPALGKRGADAPGWKGGRYSSPKGYVYVYQPEHPRATAKGYVLEHRLVMEYSIGRTLEVDEDVNHINGDKGDNRIENLMLVRHNKHYKLNQCPNCNFEWAIR